MRVSVTSSFLACLSAALAVPVENNEIANPALAARHQDRQSAVNLPTATSGHPNPTTGLGDSSIPDVNEIISALFPTAAPGLVPDVSKGISITVTAPMPGTDDSSFPLVDDIISALQGAS